MQLPPTEPKAWWSSSALPVYRYRVGQTRHFSIWSNSLFSCLCSGKPLCHYYTDNALCRQGCEDLSLYSEFQKAKFNQCRKILLSVRTFDEEKSTAQKSVPTWHELLLKKILSNLGRIFKTNFPTTCREYQTLTSAQVGRKKKSHF